MIICSAIIEKSTSDEKWVVCYKSPNCGSPSMGQHSHQEETDLTPATDIAPVIKTIPSTKVASVVDTGQVQLEGRKLKPIFCGSKKSTDSP